MGNLNNTFFDALDAAATWSAGVAFKRSKGLPLDKYSVFESKDLAIEYAEKRGAYAETPVSYPGQVIAVQEGTKMVAYVLNENADSTKLELQQIGIIPTGDNKTINVTEDGKISLLIAEGSDTAAGSQLTLQADGTIKWVKPDTTTAEGQTKAIKALQDTVDGTVTEDGTVVVEGLVHKVGNAASGEDAATGLYKLIVDEAKRADDAEKALDAKIGAASVPETAEGTGDGKAASGVYVAIEAEAARAKAAEEALDDRIEILEGKEDKDTTYLVKEGEKVLSLTGTEFGTTLKLAYNDTKIQILGINDELVTELDASAFVADGVLEDVEYDAENDKLIFTWNVIDPETNAKKVVEVDVKDLVDTYTAGNGIDITNNVVSAKVDANDKYLTVDTNGIHTKGIDDAINTAKQEAIGEVTKLANGAVKTNTEAIATLNGDTNTVGSIDAKVAAAEGRVDAKLANKANKSEVYTKDEIASLNHATKSEVEQAVAAEAQIARAAEEANAKAIAAINDSDAIDSFADVVTALAGKQDILTEGAYATESYVDTKVKNLEDTKVAEAKAQADKGVEDAKKAHDAADAAQGTANSAVAAAGTNAANIDELEKVLYGKVIAADEQYPEQSKVTTGMIAKVANNEARIGLAEGTIAAHTTAIGENKTAAQNAQNKADEAYTLAGTKTTMAEVEAKGYAVAETVNGELNSIKQRLEKEEQKADIDTTYTFENGTEGTFKVTPKGGKAQPVDTGAKAYTDTAIATALAEAKKYADDNDADTKYGIVYDKDNKKIKLTNNVAETEIDATDFIKDGMIDTVELSEDGLKLIITWNADGDKDVTEIPLSGLVDVYTGVDGEQIKVEVSTDNKISASLKTKVVEDIAKGVAAKTAIDTYGDIVTHNTNEFATAAQGGKADTAIQTVAVGTGLKATVDATDATKITIDIDEAVTFILRGGSATGFTTVTENN